MAKTVVGLFDTMQEAQGAVQALQNSGFSQDRISLVANNARGEYDVDTAERTGSEAEEGAVVGATSGAVLGGLGGLLVGLGALAIPGIGPVVGGGALLATLAGAGIGAAAGGLVGALVGAGIPEEDANVYAEGVRRGGALVTVEAQADEDAYRAADILNDYNAIDIDQRAEEYRAGGWTRFDENAEPYDLSASTTGSSDEYARSSKVGTATGGVAGAATGAAVGSAGGPVGTVVGGVAGAVAGGGVGAAGDTAGAAADRDEQRSADYDPAVDRDQPRMAGYDPTVDRMDTGTQSAEEQREMSRVDYDTSIQAQRDDAISVPDQRQVADVNYDATTDRTGDVDRTPSATVEGTPRRDVDMPEQTRTGMTYDTAPSATVGGTSSPSYAAGTEAPRDATSSDYTRADAETTERPETPEEDNYERSSKVGTATGSVAGAATGAAADRDEQRSTDYETPDDTATGAAAGSVTPTGMTTSGSAQTPQVADVTYDTTDRSDVADVDRTPNAGRTSDVAGTPRVKIYREGDATASGAYSDVDTTAGNEPRERSLTDRIEDATGLDIDRDDDVAGRPKDR